MSIANWFWVIYVLAIVYSFYGFYDSATMWYRRAAGFWVLWLLVGILGYHVFGSAVSGR